MREVSHKSKIYKNYRNFRILDELLEQFLDGPMDNAAIDKYWEPLKNVERLDFYLEKLLRDGNVIQKPNGMYDLTGAGYFLILEDGYKEREISKDRLAYRIEKNEGRVRNATIWAAIIGAALLAWEVIKYFLNKNPESINYFN